MSIRQTLLLTCAAGIGLASAPAIAGSEHAQSIDKIHPHMVRLLDERGPAKAWIYFKDKGLSDAGERRRELQFVLDTMNPRALRRRLQRREAPGIVDFNDLPVQRRYIDQAVATGAHKVVESSWLNAISVYASRVQLERIAALPFVDRIEAVRRGVLVDGQEDSREQQGSLQALTVANFYGETFEQLKQIGVTGMHERGATGEGVIIGILDTGFLRTHDAFNQPGHVVNVLAEYDFINDDGNTANEGSDDPNQHDHGTWILGTMASYLPQSLIGAAHKASFVLAKTEDITNEYMQEEDFYVAGLQFIEANGADIATSSLGYIDWYTQSDLDGLTAVTTIGVNLATANGLICVTAAGNSGNDSDPSTSNLIAPADAFDVITVGAVDPAGVIAFFSSDGPTADGRIKPEVLATGFSTATVSVTSNTSTSLVAGTSLSTPLIAGALACIVQMRPSWTVTEMRTHLFESGNYFNQNGLPDPNSVLGYGIPNAKRAAQAPGRVGTSPAQPQGPPTSF